MITVLLIIFLIVVFTSLWGFLNPKIEKLAIDGKTYTVLWYNGFVDNVAQRKYIILW